MVPANSQDDESHSGLQAVQPLLLLTLLPQDPPFLSLLVSEPAYGTPITTTHTLPLWRNPCRLPSLGLLPPAPSLVLCAITRRVS